MNLNRRNRILLIIIGILVSGLPGILKSVSFLKRPCKPDPNSIELA